MEENNKLYSQNAIAVATFFGGPFAAGILIRKNCITLGHERQGFNALVIGIITTFLLFGCIFVIPESDLDKVPNALFPTIYTAIIYYIVEKLQGKELKAHKAGNGAFYSNWRATGIGAVCCLISVAVLIGGLWLGEKDWDMDQYNAKMEQFDRNDALGLHVYDILDDKPKKQVIEYIETVSIPKLQENMDLLKAVVAIEDIPSEYVKYSNLLLDYCRVRLDMYKVTAKIVEEETDAYDQEIERLGQQLDEIIKQINE